MSLENLAEQMPIISQSWKRSHERGLSPSDPINHDVLNNNRLRNVLKKNEYIIKQTTTILEKLYPSINAKGIVTVLVDQEGTIIHKVGDLDVQNAIDYLAVGTNWSEEIKGTNAMGIAIYDQKSIIIHADHHFNIQNHFLTCAASPVYSSTGEFLGAINISMRKELYHPFYISLASLIATTLQNQLLFEQMEQEKTLLLKELETTSNASAKALLSLDHNRIIIRANRSARHILGENCIGKQFHDSKHYSVEIISDYTFKTYPTVISLKKSSHPIALEEDLYTTTDIIGSCAKIVIVKKMIQKAASSDYPVIIYGETGTGKELVAQSLHSAGPRKEKPFIAMNCSAIPESLLESELFGYEKGAFTGARREGTPGKFESASGGTLLLDEIADMSLKAQAALLRVLQEKKVTRVGGVKAIPIDTRIVAATNKNLRQEVSAGRFREDLYYRLTGIFITLPPLRERTDMCEIAEYVLKKVAQPTAYLSEKAKRKIASYPWPGNVRELRSVLMQASFWTEEDMISEQDIIFEALYEQQNSTVIHDPKQLSSLVSKEKDTITHTLESVGWNISQAAKILKISRNTLYLKIKKFNL